MDGGLANLFLTRNPSENFSLSKLSCTLCLLCYWKLLEAVRGVWDEEKDRRKSTYGLRDTCDKSAHSIVANKKKLLLNWLNVR